MCAVTPILPPTLHQEDTCSAGTYTIVIMLHTICNLSKVVNQSCLSLPADCMLTGAATSAVVLLQHCSIVACMSFALTSRTHYAAPKVQINIDWQLYAHTHHIFVVITVHGHEEKLHRVPVSEHVQ